MGEESPFIKTEYESCELAIFSWICEAERRRGSHNHDGANLSEQITGWTVRALASNERVSTGREIPMQPSHFLEHKNSEHESPDNALSRQAVRTSRSSTVFLFMMKDGNGVLGYDSVW